MAVGTISKFVLSEELANHAPLWMGKLGHWIDLQEEGNRMTAAFILGLITGSICTVACMRRMRDEIRAKWHP